MNAAQLEALDVLDAHGNPTGQVKARGAVHEDGDWHRAIHVWVVRPGGSVLLQRRAATKDLEGGRLDVSVGGHVRAGELLIDSLREAEEELGLALRPGQVEYLCTFVSVRDYPELGLVDREHQDVYLAHDDRPLSQYRLPPDEVEAVYEVPIARAIQLFGLGEHVAAPGYDSMRRPSNALLYEADLPSQGRELLATSLERVAAYLDEAGAPDLVQRPDGPTH